jgi:hypothetical protein
VLTQAVPQKWVQGRVKVGGGGVNGTMRLLFSFRGSGNVPPEDEFRMSDTPEARPFDELLDFVAREVQSISREIRGDNDEQKLQRVVLMVRPLLRKLRICVDERIADGIESALELAQSEIRNLNHMLESLDGLDDVNREEMVEKQRDAQMSLYGLGERLQVAAELLVQLVTVMSLSEGNWSIPMTQKEMASRLNVTPYKLGILTRQYPLYRVNRQTFRIRVDQMDTWMRNKLGIEGLPEQPPTR